MKKIKMYIAVALTLGIASSSVGCSLIERTEESKNKTVLAKVGNVKITRGELDESLANYFEYYKQQYGEDFESDETLAEKLKELRTQQLNALVDKEVLKQSKEELGVNPTDEELQTEIDERMNYYKGAVGGSEEEFKSYIESIGYSEESFSEMIKENIIIGMTVDKIVDDVEITDEEVEAYYNDNKDKYTTKAYADVTYLYFEVETDKEGNEGEGAREAARTLAEQARNLALEGNSLESISTMDGYVNKCTYTNAGSLKFEESGMNEVFTNAFSKLPAEEVSDIVEDTDGYYVIVNTYVQSEDVVKPFKDVEENIRGNLLYEKQQATYDKKLSELKESLNVKVYENRI